MFTMGQKRRVHAPFIFIDDQSKLDLAGISPQKEYGHVALILKIFRAYKGPWTTRQLCIALEKHPEYKSEQMTRQVVNYAMHVFKEAEVIQFLPDELPDGYKTAIQS